MTASVPVKVELFSVSLRAREARTDLRRVELVLDSASEQSLELAPSEAVLCRPVLPLEPQPRQVDWLLAVARLDCRDLRGVEA
jgi:hypothetical protein